jgi:predicted metal-dependent hydrolase
MSRQEPLELPAEEEVDPDEQDRRHGMSVTLCSVEAEDPFARGLELIRAGSFFEAHEELELAWRAAPEGERDFLQGLVHVAVAWYQAGRGKPVATASQLAKAQRRLAAYAPEHRGVDIGLLLGTLSEAQRRVAAGNLLLPLPF